MAAHRANCTHESYPGSPLVRLGLPAPRAPVGAGRHVRRSRRRPGSDLALARPARRPRPRGPRVTEIRQAGRRGPPAGPTWAAVIMRLCGTDAMARPRKYSDAQLVAALQQTK